MAWTEAPVLILLSKCPCFEILKVHLGKSNGSSLAASRPRIRYNKGRHPSNLEERKFRDQSHLGHAPLNPFQVFFGAFNPLFATYFLLNSYLCATDLPKLRVPS
jgi:hypothetical protein